jgi:hypothetical protein
MAQSDIIDIDQLLPEEELLLSQPLDKVDMTMAGVPVADKIYTQKSGDLVPADFKNFLVEKLNISPSIIDTVVGKPYGFRDRLVNLNPVDALRDLTRLRIPGTQPLGEGQQPFGLNLNELLSPSTPEVRRARAAGIDVEKGAPYQVMKDAEYLPADQRDRGIRLLLKEYYPETPIQDFDIKLEPRTNRLIYKDPESGSKQFVNPPGIDRADVQAIMEPVALELATGLLGLKAGMTAGPYVGGGVGGAAGLAYTAQLTDNPFFQALGTAAGATAGAVSAPVTFTALGEGMGHFVWRYQNLRGLKDRGILDETYTNDKILETAIKDAGIVGLLGLGGNAAFQTVGKFLTANPVKIGIDEKSFVDAYEKVQGIKETGSAAEKKALEDITTPEILQMADETTPGVRGVLQKEVELSAKARPEVETRVARQAKAKEEGYDVLFEQTGIDPIIFDIEDLSTVNANLGNRILNAIDTSGKTTDKAKGALFNQLKVLENTNKPENLFKTFWKPREVSNSEMLFEYIPDEVIPDFKQLIYRDFIDQTGKNPTAVKKYLADHSEKLKLWYGDDFVEGLKGYNKIIDDITVLAAEEGLPSSAFQKLVTGLVRAYVGIFTRPGRFITAGGQVTENLRKGSFEDMILNPDRLYDRIKRGEFFSNPATQALARAVGRAYGQEEVVGRAEVDQPTSEFPVEMPDLTAGLEEVQLSRGGEPLMELKY